jgi:hypothetical protein
LSRNPSVNNCFKCEVSSEEKDLRKCPICFKLFCEDCGASRGGRWFCTKQCCDYFFFGDVDD